MAYGYDMGLTDQTNELRDLLIHKRESAGLTLREVAVRVGAEPTRFASWELGEGLELVALYVRALESLGAELFVRPAKRH